MYIHGTQISACRISAFTIIALLISGCGGSDQPEPEPQSNASAYYNVPSSGGPSINWAGSSNWANKTVRGSVSLEAWAQWTTTGTEKVDFLVDGSVVATTSAAYKQPGVPLFAYYGMWQSGAMSDGEHSVSARVTDKSGRTADTPALKTTIQNNEPIVVALASAEEYPANSSLAKGCGQVVANATTGAISGALTLTGMTPSAVEIHEGFALNSGPVIAALINNPTNSNRWEIADGTQLTAAQIAKYRRGAIYIDAHSIAYPDGEIRGQILHERVTLAYARLDGAQVTPPVATTASATAAVTDFYNNGYVLNIQIRASSIDSAISAGFYSNRGFGDGLESNLAKDPLIRGHWSNDGSEPALMANYGDASLKVNSQAFPNGEIRSPMPDYLTKVKITCPTN